ncbi:hypothetical protein [Roseivirga sp. E12]|uniref:hypothetical protein n=1 Tax=Roseivirga sp. E12 TaxID=2819237 RepID=UPI001ABC9C62|nr:hypothetical protein [Roseivirga sp. E12]MBO3696859.1 hypothetical protein [Roseivirga sp. E12]
MLTERQKDFITDSEGFIIKNEVDTQVNRLLYSFHESLSSLIEEKPFHLPAKLGKTPFKVSKGNNHKGFPFQVIDFPASLGQTDAYSFRSVIWYGNFFSFSLLLKGEPKTIYESYLSRLTSKGYTMTWADNIWETEISIINSIDINVSSLEKARGIYQSNEALKIFKSYNLNQIDDFERLGVECFKDFFGQD